MKKVLIDVSNTNDVLYSKEFNVKVSNGEVLDVTANFTLDNCHLMTTLETVEDVEVYQRQLEIARAVFDFRNEDGEDINEYMSEPTLLNTYVGFFETFMDDIMEAVESSKPINRPKGLQSQAGKSINKPRRY